MNIKTIAILIGGSILGFSLRGVLSYFGFYLGRVPETTPMVSISPYGSIDKLNEIAEDETISAEGRAAAVYSLFAHYLKPTADGATVRQVIKATNWLKDASLSEVVIMGGRFPIQGSPGDTLFTVQLFKDRAERWLIYLCLTGKGTALDARAFFEGPCNASNFSSISAFTLCYPHPYRQGGMGREEMFTKRRLIVNEREL